MKAPEIPINEQARLQSLHSLEILDGEFEERFDRLTRMAKRMFNVPIALVSLVDEDRQWFKSCFGLPVRETPRDISFCGHAILGTKTFVIEDATKDDRFFDNPLVLEAPNIRFYAGFPLGDINGIKLGTLCIIDDKPRKFSAEDLSAFEDLGTLAERELSAIQLATLDELTGISNRRGFCEIAEFSFNVCKRQNIDLSLIFIDLDHFKEINDNYGHAAGDQVLLDFSELLSVEMRESDLFGRLGGDEFVVLMINTQPLAALKTIERFKKILNEFNKNQQEAFDIEFSFGIVGYDKLQHKTVEDLIAAGDKQMYAQKKLHHEGEE